MVVLWKKIYKCIMGDFCNPASDRWIKTCEKDKSQSQGGMNMDDIKACLSRAGLSTTGSRAELRARMCGVSAPPAGNERTARPSVDKQQRQRAEKAAQQQAAKAARQQAEKAARQQVEKAARQQAEKARQQQTLKAARQMAEKARQQQILKAARQMAEARQQQSLKEARQRAEKMARQQAEKEARQRAEKEAQQQQLRQQTKGSPLFKKNICDADQDALATCRPNWLSKDQKFTKLALQYLSSLHDPTVSLDTSDDTACEIMAKYGPTDKWLDDQDKYLRKLEKDPATEYLLFGYHHQGDQFINGFLRGAPWHKIYDRLNDMDEPPLGRALIPYLTEADLSPDGHEFMETDGLTFDELSDLAGEIGPCKYFTSEACERAFGKMVDKFVDIIRAGPKLDKDIVVYRGLSQPLIRGPEGNSKAVTSTAVTSTSMDFRVAMSFASSDDIGTIIVIHLPKGTPCLVLAMGLYNEYEILLAPGTKVELTSSEDIEITKMPHTSPDYISEQQQIDDGCDYVTVSMHHMRVVG